MQGDHPLISPSAKLTAAVVQDQEPYGVTTKQWHFWGQQAWAQHPEKKMVRPREQGSCTEAAPKRTNGLFISLVP